MSHPPGYENTAFLYFPSNPPTNITDERICLIKFSGISNLFILLVSIITLFFFFSTVPPKLFSISNIISVS